MLTQMRNNPGLSIRLNVNAHTLEPLTDTKIQALPERQLGAMERRLSGCGSFPSQLRGTHLRWGVSRLGKITGRPGTHCLLNVLHFLDTCPRIFLGYLAARLAVIMFAIDARGEQLSDLWVLYCGVHRIYHGVDVPAPRTAKKGVHFLFSCGQV